MAGGNLSQVLLIAVLAVTVASEVHGDKDLSARFYRISISEGVELFNPIRTSARRLIECGSICLYYPIYNGEKCYSFHYESTSLQCNISQQIGFRRGSSGSSSEPIIFSLVDHDLVYSDDLALGKVTDVSSVGYNRNGSKAIDGDINTFMHTADSGDPYPWFKLDMEAEQLVLSVSVQTRAFWNGSLEVNERFHDVAFYVGAHSQASSLAQASNLCYYQVDVVEAGSLTEFECTSSDRKLYNYSSSQWEYYQRGRYLMIQLNYTGSFAILQMSEVYIAGYTSAETY